MLCTFFVYSKHFGEYGYFIFIWFGCQSCPWNNTLKWIQKPCDCKHLNHISISLRTSTLALFTKQSAVVMWGHLFVIPFLSCLPFTWDYTVFFEWVFMTLLKPQDCENVGPQITLALIMSKVYFINGKKITNLWAYLCWSFHSFVCIMIDLPMCAHRSYYASTWFYIFWENHVTHALHPSYNLNLRY